MARIRTIKPEFFTSEDIVSLTPLSRLFYVSLWCESDREGRLSWKPGTFKLRYLPGDDCDIFELARELTDSGLVFLYEIDGKTYAYIPSFTDHQVINNREKDSIIPKYEENFHATLTRESGVKAERKGKEGKGKDTLPNGNDGEPSKQEGLTPYQIEKKTLFDEGVPYLVENGTKETQARSLIGKWVKANDVSVIMEAIQGAKITATGNPVPYIEKFLRKTPGGMSEVEQREIKQIFERART